MFVEEAIISLRRCSWGTACYCLSCGFFKTTNPNQWPSGVTDLSLLIFKRGDGWMEREETDRQGGITEGSESEDGWGGERLE